MNSLTRISNGFGNGIAEANVKAKNRAQKSIEYYQKREGSYKEPEPTVEAPVEPQSPYSEDYIRLMTIRNKKAKGSN